MATLATTMQPGATAWPAPARWRYADAGQRDLRLDLLRGFFVIAMLIDHLGGASWLYAVTGGNRFYVSAAEGFVLLSGLVMGLVYRRLIERDGLGAATRRAVLRAATLYSTAVALTLAFRVASSLAGASWAEPGGDLLAFARDAITLRQSYYLADVLMLYAVLVLAAPLALALLAHGRTGLLLGASVGVWAAYQAGLLAPLDGVFAGLIVFPPFAWQLLFAAGLAAGYHWQ